MKKLSRYPRIIFIVGATATGKSRLALRACERFGGEIINADSVQVFKDLNIGTAKVTREERNKCPHHLVDICSPNESFTAGEFRRRALEVIAERFKKNVSTFYIVGGSGFYIQALVKGLYPIPPSDVKLRNEIEKEILNFGAQKLFLELQSRDPVYAKKIGPNDHFRIVRAIEILRSSKIQTITELESSTTNSQFPFFYKTIGLKRLKAHLAKDIRLRTKNMFRDGLVEEVKTLIEKGFENSAPLNSVGYKETKMLIKNQVSQEEAEDLIVQNTLRLAKRQNTWFKRDISTLWFDPDHSQEAPLEYLSYVL